MNIPIWAFILLVVFAAIGVIHLIAYIFLLVGGIIGYRENKKINEIVDCPYFVESRENEKE